jgi:mannose-1-phosphate guanylyltransferase/mannose-6-phosphate isomerase
MVDHEVKVYPVLLAGGTGTRLWPVSRELYPKQLVSFIGKDSLVQRTIKRVFPVLDPDNIRIVCGQEHFFEMARHMEEIGVRSEGKIIPEPCGRNTAPAILLAVLDIQKKEKDAVLCIFPADHVIRDIEKFHEKLMSAIRLADKGHVVTFGITPHYPETGYGYIEGSQAIQENALRIKRFVEKPDIETAVKYVEAGNFFWNSGMFAFKMSVILEEFHTCFPGLLKDMEKMLSTNEPLTREQYETLPDISIDYAIMEKTDKGVVLPSDFGWSDIGSWKSLYDFLPKDENSNVIDGDVITQDTENCIIMGYERLIATNHLSNMVVVETPDSVFVSELDRSRDVKAIVAGLKEKGREEYHRHRTVYYPWGNRTLLDRKGDVSVFKTVIYAGSTCSIEQKSSSRKNLIVTEGSVKAFNGKDSLILFKGDVIRVSRNDTIHLENLEKDPAWLIEINIPV